MGVEPGLTRHGQAIASRQRKPAFITSVGDRCRPEVLECCADLKIAVPRYGVASSQVR